MSASSSSSSVGIESSNLYLTPAKLDVTISQTAAEKRFLSRRWDYKMDQAACYEKFGRLIINLVNIFAENVYLLFSRKAIPVSKVLGEIDQLDNKDNKIERNSANIPNIKKIIELCDRLIAKYINPKSVADLKAANDAKAKYNAILVEIGVKHTDESGGLNQIDIDPDTGTEHKGRIKLVEEGRTTRCLIARREKPPTFGIDNMLNGAEAEFDETLAAARKKAEDAKVVQIEEISLDEEVEEVKLSVENAFKSLIGLVLNEAPFASPGKNGRVMRSDSKSVLSDEDKTKFEALKRVNFTQAVVNHKTKIQEKPFNDELIDAVDATVPLIKAMVEKGAIQLNAPLSQLQQLQTDFVVKNAELKLAIRNLFNEIVALVFPEGAPSEITKIGGERMEGIRDFAGARVIKLYNDLANGVDLIEDAPANANSDLIAKKIEVLNGYMNSL